MLASLRNIVTVSDLRRRVLFTLAILAVYRLGSVIPTPGVNTAALAILADQMAGTMFGLYNMFSGGNLAQVTIFALGIMPYISASIILQMLTALWPYLERLSKDGELGRRTITQYTRYGTLVLCGVQALAIAVWLESQTNIAGGLPLVDDPGWGFRLLVLLTLTTGTCFIMWLGEQITERGIGNGMALIIFAGIVVNLPAAILNMLDRSRIGAMGLVTVIAPTIVMVFVTGAVVFIMLGHRRVTVQYAKRVVGRRMYGRTSTQILLRVNTSGVIPVIFGSSFLGVLAMAATAFPVGGWGEVIRYNLQSGMPLYYLLYMASIIFFAYVYTAVTFNPDDLAENLRKYGGCVPGIRPGKRTAEYIDTILTRITLVWSICLALVAIHPDLMIVGFQVNAIPFIGDSLDAVTPRFITEGLGVTFYFVGGTSLLILVGVSMDTIQQVQSQLIRRPDQPGSVEGSDGGSTLVDTEPVWSADVEYETFVPTLTPRGAAMVACVDSLLRSVGIRFYIKNERLQDLFGIGRIGTDFSVVMGAPAVWVEPTRADEAAALLARIEAERLIGTVVHYFATPQVGVVQLAADLEVGETLRFRGRGADFQQVAQSMQIDHRPVQTAAAATDVAVKVDQRVRAGTHVYRVTLAEHPPANLLSPSSARSP